MINSPIVRYTRFFAFVLLAVITVYGAYRFVAGDWTDVIAYWQSHRQVIPLLALLSVFDVALEMIAWMWVYHRFGIRCFDRDGGLAFLAGRAGLILPAQLGRLMRPDAVVKLERASVPDALKAEGVVFVFDSISVVALIAGLIVYLKVPAAAPVAAIAVVASLVFLGNTINQFVTHTHLRLPMSFWWSPQTAVIVLANMAGWVAHGLALHVVVSGLPGGMTLWDSLFMAPGSAVLGVATGLPGGIGATEGILGASLRLKSVPMEHLAVAVAAFRLITFWIWIPIGWLAIAALRRRISRRRNRSEAAILTDEGI